jgi:carbamoyltransferase
VNFLGFYLGRHDSNITLTDGRTVQYFKAERIFGIKHEFRPLDWVKQVCAENNFVPDAVAYSDGDRNGLGQCAIGKLYCRTKERFGVPTYCLDHYYAHILSAWPLVAMEDVNIGIGIDGKGDHQMSRRTILNPGNLETIKSVEYCSGKSIGRFFAKVGHMMGLKVGRLSNGIKLTMDYAGKVMGAQAYGNPKHKMSHTMALNNPYGMLDLAPQKCKFKNQAFLNWLASAHKAIEFGIRRHFKTHCKPPDCIVYSGGVAQNTVINNTLYLKYPNLYIPPHCYDGGMSLGCVEFLRLKFKQPEFDKTGFPYWQQDNIETMPTLATIRRTAKLLADGKIVGWMQGHGEVGPRALGNRSILMHPGTENGKDILNKGVKHREHWRPYAPSVLEKCASEWFEIDKPSPYMLRTVKVKSDKIPAVTHVDQTSRIQTVRGGHFEKLIEEFYKLTGIPMVLNTSFNGGGEPIYSTPEQALKLYNKSKMDAVCIGKTIYEKAV